MKRQTVNANEAAEILGVAAPTIYAAVKRGELPSVKIGDRVLIPRVALQHMLEGPKGSRRLRTATGYPLGRVTGRAR